MVSGAKALQLGRQPLQAADHLSPHGVGDVDQDAPFLRFVSEVTPEAGDLRVDHPHRATALPVLLHEAGALHFQPG